MSLREAAPMIDLDELAKKRNLSMEDNCEEQTKLRRHGDYNGALLDAAEELICECSARNALLSLKWIAATNRRV